MSHIYLIRHAQASFGQADYDQLSPLGYRQAAALAEYLQITGIHFDTFYTGENRRHAQTLSEYQKTLSGQGIQIPVEKTSAFNEYDFETVLKTIIPELIAAEPDFKHEVDRMLEDNRIFQGVFEKTLYNWLERPEQFPRLKTWSDFSQNVRQAITSIIETEGSKKNLAVFTSGGVIAAIMQSALKLSDKETLKISWQILNVSVTHIKYYKNELTLAGFNDVGFLRVLPDSRELVTYR